MGKKVALKALVRELVLIEEQMDALKFRTGQIRDELDSRMQLDDQVSIVRVREDRSLVTKTLRKIQRRRYIFSDPKRVYKLLPLSEFLEIIRISVGKLKKQQGIKWMEKKADKVAVQTFVVWIGEEEKENDD